jgi:hypothetical protein
MTPALIIEQVTAEGVRLTLGTDGNIKAAGDQKAVARWLPIIRAQKPGIVEALQAADNIVIESAAVHTRLIYWERADLSIAGPAQPEFLAQVGTGPRTSYWVVAQFEGGPVWINSVVLRSRQAFEHQATRIAFDRVSETHRLVEAAERKVRLSAHPASEGNGLYPRSGEKRPTTSTAA